MPFVQRLHELRFAESAYFFAYLRRHQEYGVALTALSGTMEKPWDLLERTMQFAVATFDFCRPFSRHVDARHAIAQLRRSAAGVGANYRAARRARSDRDFANKIGVVIEEADEADFWLEYLVRTKVVERRLVADVQQEANELVAILTAAGKTARSRDKAGKGMEVVGREQAVPDSSSPGAVI